MTRVQRLVLADSFDADAKFVPAGHIGTFDDDNIGENDKHLVDPAGLPPTATVEIAAIAPTGPNPTTPQQLPAGAVQAPGGGYVLPGKQLVSEVTAPAETRIDAAGLGENNTEAEVSAALSDLGLGTAPTPSLNNDDDALVAGTVADVTANLGEKTDEQLNAMLAAEQDREKPRKGVTDAIQAELDERASR